MIEIMSPHVKPIAPSEDVCPVCNTPVIMRNGHTVCISPMCRERVIEGCCGD
jgi:hypothetical protein